MCANQGPGPYLKRGHQPVWNLQVISPLLFHFIIYLCKQLWWNNYFARAAKLLTWAPTSGRVGGRDKSHEAGKEGWLSTWWKLRATACSVPGDCLPCNSASLSQDNRSQGRNGEECIHQLLFLWGERWAPTGLDWPPHTLLGGVCLAPRVSHALASAGKPQNKKSEVCSIGTK